MKARNCCKTMEAELTAWKADVDDIVRKMEHLTGSDREKAFPHIEDLHMFMTEMDDRIHQIRETCVPETGIDDIHKEKELFDQSPSTIHITPEQAMSGLGAGNFGG